jgi:hypothetical protein
MLRNLKLLKIKDKVTIRIDTIVFNQKYGSVVQQCHDFDRKWGSVVQQIHDFDRKWGSVVQQRHDYGQKWDSEPDFPYRVT